MNATLELRHELGAPDPPALPDLSDVERRLEARFCPLLGPDEVHRCTTEAAASLQSARIRTFVALLVERTAADRLRALASEAAADTANLPPAAAATPTPIVTRATPPGRLSRWRRGWRKRSAPAGRRPARIGAGETPIGETPIGRKTSC